SRALSSTIRIRMRTSQQGRDKDSLYCIPQCAQGNVAIIELFSDQEALRKHSFATQIHATKK
ncbi:MAG: hypothetical protein ACRC8I_02910, partial [Plesiomonas shigelloides]